MKKLIVISILLTSLLFAASGKKAPNFSLQTPDGKVIKLSDYKGKIVILNFFATWCPPCKIEIPDFVKFYNKNKEWFADFAKLLGRPMLIEMFDERYAYFITKFEFNFIDSMDKASALSTVQIDHENAERYGITYIDEDGKEKYPYLLHASISGGVDRCVCALLEKEAIKMREGRKASFPFWLSPTQVRIIPVNEKLLEECIQLAGKIKARVDIDDRDESVSKKIRDAEKEWIPIILVYGEKEREGMLKPRWRFECNEEEVDINRLNEIIKEKMEGFPFKPLALPIFLSKRAKFR